MLSLGRFVVGTAACVAVIAALASGALALRRALLPPWRGARARLAEITIALATFFAVAQLLGALHLFSAWAVLLGEVVAGLALGATTRLLPTGAHPH